MNYKIELSVEELNVVLAALGEMPAKITLKIINSIYKQAETQELSDKDKKEVKA